MPLIISPLLPSEDIEIRPSFKAQPSVDGTLGFLSISFLQSWSEDGVDVHQWFMITAQ